jgi:hypothetical protein
VQPETHRPVPGVDRSPADGDRGKATLVDVTGIVIYFSVATMVLRGTLL